MSAVETSSTRPAFGTWLIPVLVFGSILCVAVIACLKLSFTYVCSFRRPLSSAEEAGLPRSVPTKEYSRTKTVQDIIGPVDPRVTQARHNMLFSKSDSTTHSREPIHQYTRQESPPETYRDLQSEVDSQQPLHNQQIHQSQSLYFNHQSQHQQAYQPSLLQFYRLQQQSQLSDLPPLPQSLLQSSEDPNNCLGLAYDDAPSLSSQESTSFYPIDSILGGLHNDQSFHSDDTSFEVPSLKFTPPSANDLASLGLEPVCSLEEFLQAPDVDRFGRAVTQSKDLTKISTPEQDLNKNRSVAIVGINVVIAGTNEDYVLEQESDLRNILRDVEQSVEVKKKRRVGAVFSVRDGVSATKEGEETGGSSCDRRSFMTKVSVPSTNDLWKFWVTRWETLEEFTRRVREKLGFEVMLFVEEEILATEEDWISMPGGSKITAHPL